MTACCASWFKLRNSWIVSQPELSRNGLPANTETGFEDADRSQLPMPESLAFDRIAFAWCPPLNRTVHVPSREKPAQRPSSLVGSPFSAVRFAEELSRKMGIFRVFRGKVWRNFSALQTAWRSAQSGANLSPAKFPANRENNREFARF